MYARPAEALVGNAPAEEARDLIRRCVHCGFCLPACPTYRVTGNELDSPRGRIYLIKELVERGTASETTRTHLDRCLTCRACEPACPSGVEYGRLVDLGRDLVQARPPQAPRALRERLLRSALLAVATRRSLFTPLVRLAQALRGSMPRAAMKFVPPPPPDAQTVAAARECARPVRRMVVLEGCVQPGLAPQINAAARRVLERLDIALVPAHEIGCCGAMDHHLGRVGTALDKVRRNVAAGARRLDDGVEAIVSTASGCGVFAKDYGYVLRHGSPDLHRDGARVAAATRDLCEVIDVASLARLHAARAAGGARLRVAWQAPCSLQHGQHAATAGKVEAILEAVDCELVPVVDASLCCGSAGTYSLLQPGLSRELRARKLASLLGPAPDVIATANVGCLEHLRQASPIPVRHWIELVDEALERGTPANAQAVATTT